MQNKIKALMASPGSTPWSLYMSVSEEAVRENYRSLLKLIVGEGDIEKVCELVSSITWTPRKKHRFVNFLLELNKLIEENVSIHFLLRLDWKAGVKDLARHIENALAGHDYAPNLPDPQNYPSNASVQHGYKSVSREEWNASFEPGDVMACWTSPVFEHYILALNEVGLGLGFFATLSDEFLLFVYRLSDEQEIKKYMEACGAEKGHGFIM